MKTKLILIAFLLISAQAFSQAIYVSPGTEIMNFGSMYFVASSNNLTCTTGRVLSKGYFSTVGDATYEKAIKGPALLIDGYVKYYRSVGAVANSFTYPVGTLNDYHPLTIYGSIPDNGIFATAWIKGGPSIIPGPTDNIVHATSNVHSPITNVLPFGQWDWQDISNSSAGMNIKASIPNTNMVPSSLRLVGWDGIQWINLSTGTAPFGNSYASVSDEETILEGTMQKNITAIGVGTVGSLKMEAKNTYSIYPNPFQNILTILLPPGTERKINIYNALGQLIKTIIAPGNTEQEINTDNLSKGIYQVVIFENGKNVFKTKVVKL